MANDKHLKEICLKLLEKDSRCRKDTKWLTYCVFRHYTGIFIPFNDFNKLPSFESVARCKREIQNKENRFNNDEFDESSDPTIKYEHPVKEAAVISKSEN